MSIFININSTPEFSYANKANVYVILDAHKDFVCKIEYGIYELRKGEKIIGFFDREMSLEQYLEDIDYKPDSFFKEITDNNVALSEEEKLVFKETKSRILKSFIESYLEGLDDIKEADFNLIKIKLKRINIKISDLEKINKEAYKLTDDIKDTLINSLKLESHILDNLEFNKKEIEELYLSDWTDWMWDRDGYDDQKNFRLGFVYTYDGIQTEAKEKNTEYKICSYENPYRYIDKKIVKIINPPDTLFMNLANYLTIKLDDKGIYQLQCSCEAVED